MDESAEQEVQDAETSEDVKPEETHNQPASPTDKFIPAEEGPINFKKARYDASQDQYEITKKLLRKGPIEKRAA